MPDTAERDSTTGQPETTTCETGVSRTSPSHVPESQAGEARASRVARRAVEILCFALTVGIFWTVYALRH
ncbi:hypothetical protein AB0395_18170 [Streptosporangium sp. NPDC051023]|uniref:hypothetical protein n=1 Tax=Streptosporangium sp. NPDC051023 TaxID=3155410 RepID=UPI00344EACCF